MYSQFHISEPPPTSGDSNIFLKEDISPELQLQFAFANGLNQVCIFLEPSTGSFPKNRPSILKHEIDSKVPSHDKIHCVKFTRTNKLLFETSDANCAQEIIKIDKLLDVPVTPYVQSDNITSRFVLHDIDPSISLMELGAEIQATNDIKVKELRRFTRKSSTGIHLSATVLVTIFGTVLPQEIKYFYMIEKIKPFYDRPRQCTKCWRYDHATSKCKNEPVCKFCAESHPTESCTSPSKRCVNCQENHDASDPNCLTRAKEVEILKYKTDCHLPITEARRRFKQSEQKTYSTATQNITSSNNLALTRQDFEETLNTFFVKLQDLILQSIEKHSNATLSFAQQQATEMVTHTQEIKQSLERFSSLVIKTVARLTKPSSTTLDNTRRSSLKDSFDPIIKKSKTTNESSLASLETRTSSSPDHVDEAMDGST